MSLQLLLSELGIFGDTANAGPVPTGRSTSTQLKPFTFKPFQQCEAVRVSLAVRLRQWRLQAAGSVMASACTRPPRKLAGCDLQRRQTVARCGGMSCHLIPSHNTEEAGDWGEHQCSTGSEATLISLPGQDSSGHWQDCRECGTGGGRQGGPGGACAGDAAGHLLCQGQVECQRQLIQHTCSREGA